MARPKRTDGTSRHGKHAPGVFRVALYLSAEEKAIAILAAELAGATLSDIFRGGFLHEATRLGILSNGTIADKYRDRVIAYRYVLEAEKKAQRRTGK